MVSKTSGGRSPMLGIMLSQCRFSNMKAQVVGNLVRGNQLFRALKKPDTVAQCKIELPLFSKAVFI